LWDSYASVLDIRVEGEADDYMLWNAVDVRTMFGSLADPDCEHLSIAMLVMEGAIADIASANWDGLIERAGVRSCCFRLL
jgi:NAD-dependent SIR2 family protein deacetylase